MGDLKLNFLAIRENEFFFKIYRLSYDPDEVKRPDLPVYKLPIENDSYEQFHVSFDEIEGFEEYNCQSYDNFNLTKRFLLVALNKRFGEVSKPAYPHFVVEGKFTETINFVYHSFDSGEQLVYLTPYFLKTKNRFGFLIDFRFKRNQDQPLNREIQKLSLSLDRNFRSNRDFYSDKFKILSKVINLSIKPATSFSLNDASLNLDCELIELESKRLEKKTYILGDGREAGSQFQGVKSYGPYGPIENDDVIYYFVFEEKHKSFGNDIFLSLIGRSNPGTFAGMEAMFRLPFSKDRIKRYSISSLNIDELKKAIEEIARYRQENPKKKIISILLEDDNTDELQNSSSPYYYFKYHMLEQGIPVQVITKENLGDKNSLKWSTSNVGLAIFSKLGGVPWIVRPSNSGCLILGLGSSHKINAEDSKVQKYFAYSICLDSSGIYKKLAILSENASEITYLEELKKNLVELLQEDQFKEYRKVVLHVPFKLKNKEIQSITSALKELNDIQFKVIKINEENKFFGFSSHNTCVPYESSYIKLSRSEYLVWFEGLNYGKEVVYKRIGSPVHIEFLNSESEAEDLPYLQDVLNLSGANWRGFNAKSIPISIYYSRLIAKYTNAFEDFETFDQSIFGTHEPWFL